MPCRKQAYTIRKSHAARSPLKTTKRVRATLKAHKAGRSIGFTARSSLKSMGLIPRSSGCYELGNKYRAEGGDPKELTIEHNDPNQWRNAAYLARRNQARQNYQTRKNQSWSNYLKGLFNRRS